MTTKAREEKWVAVEGWPYEVSDAGRVRRVGRSPLSGHTLKAGYVRVCLSDRGRTWSVGAHRLVVFAFLPEPEEGQTQVNHKNGVTGDNRVENLEWASPRENIHHAKVELGFNNRGKHHGLAHIERDTALAVKKAYWRGERVRDLADKHGIAAETARDIGRGKRWPHLHGVYTDPLYMHPPRNYGHPEPMPEPARVLRAIREMPGITVRRAAIRSKVKIAGVLEVARTDERITISGDGDPRRSKLYAGPPLEETSAGPAKGEGT